MEKLKILVVEDTPTESAALVSLLQESGYELAGTASTMADALSLYFSTDPDLVILDIYYKVNPMGLHSRRLSMQFQRKPNRLFLSQVPLNVQCLIVRS